MDFDDDLNVASGPDPSNRTPGFEGGALQCITDLVDSCGTESGSPMRTERGDCYHSCQVYKKRNRDKVENSINAREARAKIYRPRPLLVDHTHFRTIVYCHTH